MDRLKMDYEKAKQIAKQQPTTATIYMLLHTNLNLDLRPRPAVEPDGLARPDRLHQRAADPHVQRPRVAAAAHPARPARADHLAADGVLLTRVLVAVARTLSTRVVAVVAVVARRAPVARAARVLGRTRALLHQSWHVARVPAITVPVLSPVSPRVPARVSSLPPVSSTSMCADLTLSPVISVLVVARTWNICMSACHVSRARVAPPTWMSASTRSMSCLVAGAGRPPSSLTQPRSVSGSLVTAPPPPPR